MKTKGTSSDGQVCLTPVLFLGHTACLFFPADDGLFMWTVKKDCQLHSGFLPVTHKSTISGSHDTVVIAYRIISHCSKSVIK